MQQFIPNDADEYEQVEGYAMEEELEDTYWVDGMDESTLYRPRSAPARPLTELEEFKKSRIFSIIERAVMSSSQLMQTYNDRLDADCSEGQAACKSFLKQLEKLHENFKAKKAPRDYRDSFSNAYQMLYKGENYLLYYLKEIIDSAQEGTGVFDSAVPCLFVNGQKFDFSKNVLEAGHKLFQMFIDIQAIIRRNYIKVNCESSPSCMVQVRTDMVRALDNFDLLWTGYEKLYIIELMQIEASARKYVTDAIVLDKDVQEFENKEKAKGTILTNNEEYDRLRASLADQISQINSVANYDGKGRDDLSITVLTAAESMLRKISPNQSKSVRKLAENIRSSFYNIRNPKCKSGLLLRRFDLNIEAVDPQLKNNQELVNLLLLYEKYWERGKEYFLNEVRCGQLIHFSRILEGLCEKYDKFSKYIEYRQAEIFIMIPMIMIIKSCEGDDKGICEIFLPDLKNPEHKLGLLYMQVTDMLFEHNYLFSLKQDSDTKTRSTSLSKSNVFSRKSNEASPERKMGESRCQRGMFGSPGLPKYKTILGNKSEYTNCSKPSREDKEKDKQLHRKLNYTFYNLLEKLILDIELSEKEKLASQQNKDSLDTCILKVKTLAIELERCDPAEWNTFLDVALES